MDPEVCFFIDMYISYRKFRYFDGCVVLGVSIHRSVRYIDERLDISKGSIYRKVRHIERFHISKGSIYRKVRYTERFDIFVIISSEVCPCALARSTGPTVNSSVRRRRGPRGMFVGYRIEIFGILIYRPRFALFRSRTEHRYYY